MNYLVTNLYDNPRKLYKYFPISKEYAIKVVDNGKYVGLMFAPNLSREDASSVGKVIDKWRAIALDGYIFYTSPQFFNDPFDTLLPKAPEIVPPLEERKYIIDVLRRAVTIKKDEVDRLLYSDDFDRALRIVLDSRHYDRSISEEIFKAYKMDRIPYKEEVAITCFSEVNNEQLMWAQNGSCPGQNGMYRKNSCCGTERIRLFIRKNRWQNGQRFVTARIMCLTILKLTVSMRFLRLKSRRTGLEKMSASWISGKNTVLIFWQQENMEKQMLRCLRRQFWMAMLPYWFLVNIKRSRNVFESEREVISVLSVGLLFVTLVGFLSGGVLVDQIETFFTENRREEPETGQNFTENRKQEQGTGEKKIS